MGYLKWGKKQSHAFMLHQGVLRPDHSTNGILNQQKSPYIFFFPPRPLSPVTNENRKCLAEFQDEP